MGRYTGPKWKLCRREGLDLFSRGAAIVGDTPLRRRDYPPGQHADRRTKMTEYGLRLREKQKLKRIYGVRERQCLRYFREAVRMKGASGANLLCLMERRLDAAITTAGFTRTISQARQFIVHGHIRVNGRKVTIPSYRVRPGEVIEPVEKSSVKPLIANMLEVNKNVPVPAWIEVSADAMKASVVGNPTRDDFPYPIVENLVVEFYSR